MSSESTAKSAALPTSTDPFSLSSKLAYAEPIVYCKRHSHRHDLAHSHPIHYALQSYAGIQDACQGKVLRNGAGDGIRTRDINLGKVALYQLSYSRSSWGIFIFVHPVPAVN